MKNVMNKKPHSPEFKFKVAIECIRGEKTSLEICQEQVMQVLPTILKVKTLMPELISEIAS